MTDTDTKYQKAVAELESILDGSERYNVSDFKWLKSRTHEQFFDEIGDFMRANELCDSGLYYSTPYWNHFNSYVNKVEKNKQISDEKKELFLKLLAKWQVIAELLEKAAPLIVKGRKPTERTTPPRTLENTGTCAICGQNVKLDGGGRIVNHGFTIQFHQHNGWCFGVNQFPWEVSPEGAIKYINKFLLPRKQREEDFLKILVWSPNHLTRLSLELYATTKEITDYESRIANWEKQDLPGSQRSSNSDVDRHPIQAS